MYLDWIRFENFRTFRKAEIPLIHSDQDFSKLKIPKPKLPNINLLLANNGLGKSAFLKGVALAALGPAVGDAGIYPYQLVRREPNKGRYTQVKNLINRLSGKEHYTFTGDMDGGEYLFERGGLKIPFPALSDGYRAYLGWIGDLLYHVCFTTPTGAKLVENRGIVMVDEIDLHLHPKWQMTVLPILARELPNLQFIVTSHSPLLVGSLEW